MNELKPCPICASTAVFLRDGHIWKYIECMECDYKSKAVENDVAVAVQVYNYRPIDDEFRARIAELEAAARWIPVGERLPEKDKRVEISCRFYGIITGARTYQFQDGEWSYEILHTPGRIIATLDVTHWRPLPEPPEATA